MSVLTSIKGLSAVNLIISLDLNFFAVQKYLLSTLLLLPLKHEIFKFLQKLTIFLSSGLLVVATIILETSLTFFNLLHNT